MTPPLNQGNDGMSLTRRFSDHASSAGIRVSEPGERHGDANMGVGNKQEGEKETDAQSVSGIDSASDEAAVGSSSDGSETSAGEGSRSSAGAHYAPLSQEEIDHLEAQYEAMILDALEQEQAYQTRLLEREREQQERYDRMMAPKRVILDRIAAGAKKADIWAMFRMQGFRV